MYSHWQRGVIPWNTYVEHACAQACLPHQEMPEPKQKEMSEDNSKKRKRNEDEDEGNNNDDDDNEEDDGDEI